MKTFIVMVLYFVGNCNSFKILAIFPYNGRSHHIYYSALVEELAKKQHDVTVINYHPVQKLRTLRQISLQDKENNSDRVSVEEHLKVLSIFGLSMAYDTAQAFTHIANTNCKKLMKNPEVQDLIKSAAHFDVVIVEQFVTDCGLAVAYKLNAATIGMTAHILMPWTYSRLGAPNNPAYVPNHFFASGTKPNLLTKIKSLVINFGMNMYYKHVIQRNDQEIVNEVYPNVPLLEDLGNNMSLIMINQYFPLTSPRMYSSNVVEIGGMHVKENMQIENKDLQNFLDTTRNKVVYISFGSVATNFPHRITDEIIKFVEKSRFVSFVWKSEATNWTPPSNVFVGKWMPQTAILCHPKVVAFISHSGMLSTSEAAHCGVPIIGVPLFGDQFANAESAVESGLGVSVDILTLNEQVLEEALNKILEEKFLMRAKELSRLWKDRPLSPMETAIFWIEYVARNKGAVSLKPPTVDLPFYQYLLIDVIVTLGSILTLILFMIIKMVSFVIRFLSENRTAKEDMRKKRY